MVEDVVRHARRIVIFVAGFSIVLLGLVMVVAPGPGLLTIAAGLGVLAIEFAWAKRWLAKAKEVAARETDRALARMRGLARPPGGKSAISAKDEITDSGESSDARIQQESSPDGTRTNRD